MKNSQRFFYLMTLLILLLPASVHAQESQPELNLYLIRNFGYGGLGEIQGNFTLKIRDPQPELDKVEFYLDGELQAIVNDEYLEWYMNIKLRGTHNLEVIVYDYAGNSASASKEVKVFNFFGN